MIMLSILTMTIGNVSALLQNNVRRLMAYSSVAHAGYMLIGVAVGLFRAIKTLVYGGFAAAFLYLFVYGLASIGTFAALGKSRTTKRRPVRSPRWRAWRAGVRGWLA